MQIHKLYNPIQIHKRFTTLYKYIKLYNPIQIHKALQSLYNPIL